MDAAGQLIPPTLIFPKSKLTDGAPTGTPQLVSDSRFINSELFLY